MASIYWNAKFVFTLLGSLGSFVEIFQERWEDRMGVLIDVVLVSVFQIVS
jgi:hypothetical protein